MTERLEQLKRLVSHTACSVRGGDGKASTIRGTAFLVTPRHALTCAHVVGSESGQADEVTLRFSPGPRTLTARVLGTPNWALDIAVLELEREMLDSPDDLLPLLDELPSAGAPWHAFGHPRPAASDGLVLSGHVADPKATVRGQSVLQLRTSEARDSLQGASGAPVLVGGVIAGMLVRQLMGSDIEPVFEVAYALRGRELRAYLRSLDLGLPEASPTQARAAKESIPSPKQAAAAGSLAQSLNDALNRKQKLEAAGLSTSAILAEIRALKHELRLGGRLHPGDALGNRYLLVEQIGRGGFATVWRARDRISGDDIAIKVLHPQQAGDTIKRQRFFRGARIMAEFAHPLVVRIREHKIEDDGFFYFVMDFIPGGSLRDAVLERRVTREQAVPLIRRIGGALAEAHARGHIHRDVKPANILLTESGEPLLTDFDLATAPESTGGTDGGGLGTFIYAAPEMLRCSEDADARADVYGLGMTLAFMIHGGELPLDVLTHQEAFISTLPCDLALKIILKRATSPKLDDRYPSMEAFCRALESMPRERAPNPRRRMLSVVVTLVLSVIVGAALLLREDMPAGLGGTAVFVDGGLADKVGAQALGFLVVTSTPSGAEVLIDDVAQESRTPGVYSIEAGQAHRVELRLKGYQPFVSEAVTVAAQQSVTLQEQLEPLRAVLVVETEPEGVAVQLLGRTLGSTPLRTEIALSELARLGPGTPLTLSKSGYRVEIIESLERAQGESPDEPPREPIVVRRTLQRQVRPTSGTGKVRIHLDQTWANVYLGERLVGRVPDELVLPVGQHQLRLHNPASERTWTLPVSVSPDKPNYYRVPE